MRDSKLGFGLLGAGLIAPFHAKALRASALTELIAVADLDPHARGEDDLRVRLQGVRFARCDAGGSGD